MASFLVRPMLSLIAGVSIYLFGHWLDDLAYFAKRSHNEIYVAFSDGLAYLVPQFYRFNWKSFYFLENDVSGFNIGLGIDLFDFSNYLISRLNLTINIML